MSRLRFPDDYSKDQVAAIRVMETGQNCFLTGKAGTGKSSVIKEFINRNLDKNLIICASTGAAAQGLSEFGACTVHRAFGLKAQGIVKMPNKPKAEIEAADIVIIDEISMVRIDLFEHVAKTILLINDDRKKQARAYIRKHKEPPKPLQLIIVGDFTQLRPVVTSNDEQAMKELYGGKVFAFESNLWKKLQFHNLTLTTVHRQAEDKEYAERLNEIRRCDSDDPFSDTLQYFNENTSAYEFKNEDCVNLCGKNKTVKDENDFRLAELPGKTYTSEAEIIGDADMSSVTAEAVLNFKIGAKVMMLTNGNGYFNGSIGHIVRIGYINKHDFESDDYTSEECVVISIGDEEVVVKKNRWQVFKPVVKEEEVIKVDDEGKKTKEIIKVVENKEVGSVIQYPFKLGYAVTIHKSQGMTLTQGVNLKPEIWDSGQLYVALSRVDKAENIYIDGYLTRKHWKLDNKVKKFYKTFDEEWKDDNSD